MSRGGEGGHSVPDPQNIIILCFSKLSKHTLPQLGKHGLGILADCPHQLCLAFSAPHGVDPPFNPRPSRTSQLESDDDLLLRRVALRHGRSWLKRAMAAPGGKSKALPSSTHKGRSACRRGVCVRGLNVCCFGRDANWKEHLGRTCRTCNPRPREQVCRRS